MKRKLLSLVSLFFAASLVLPVLATAVPMTNDDYILDPSGMNNFGGQGSSANYQMVSTGGEAVVGNGAGGSYKLSSGYVGQLQQSIELNLLEKGLEAYYPLDTNTGSRIYDATANDNEGFITSSTGWTGGKIGEALDFPSSAAYAEVPDSSQLDFSNEMTISFWVRPTQLTTASFISKGNPSTDVENLNFQIRLITAGGQIRMIVRDNVANANRTITSTSNMDSLNSWYHIVGMRRGTQLVIFVNGVRESAGGAIGTNTISTNNEPLWLGGVMTGFSFVGQMDEVKLFNRALTDEEVRNLYDANMAGIGSAVTIPRVVPGISQNAELDMAVVTDAGGYNAAISQNANLTHTDTTTTINALAGGSIASPTLWDEGTTKGLGFTVTGGLNLDTGHWGTGPVNYKYAAIPGTPTTFFSRTGLSGGQKELTNLQFKLDVPTSQKAGQYSNIVTVTATAKP